MKNILGKHLIVDMYGCFLEQLNNLDFVTHTISTALEQAQMTLIDFSHFKIEAQGLIVIAIIEKSHLVIRTYPELGYIALEIFTSGEPSKPDKLITLLKKAFKAEKLKITNVKRGDFGSERDMKPRTKSKTTTMKRVKDTGAQVFKLLNKKKKVAP